MWCKGQRRRLAPELARTRERGADDDSMAAMDTVEIANCHHGAGQRPTIDAMRIASRHMEGSCRFIRPAHCVSGSKEITVRNVPIFSSGELFRPQLRLAR